MVPAAPPVAREQRHAPAIRLSPMDGDTKILLTESGIPTHWVNLMPDLPGEHLDFAAAILADRHRHGLDVAKLIDIPSYGRSFLDLWTEARKLRLSDKKTLAHFWRWRYARPAAGTGPIP